MKYPSTTRLILILLVSDFILGALFLAWLLPVLWSPDGNLLHRFGWLLLMAGLWVALSLGISQVTSWIADVTGMIDKAEAEDRERRQRAKWRVGAQALNRETARLRKRREERIDENATRRTEQDPANRESAESESEPAANHQDNNLDGSS